MQRWLYSCAKYRHKLCPVTLQYLINRIRSITDEPSGFSCHGLETLAFVREDENVALNEVIHAIRLQVH